MFEECQGDKFEYMKRVKALAAETRNRVEQRLVYENQIIKVWEENRTREEEKEAWLSYINFEIS
jgi:hypothetical protein